MILSQNILFLKEFPACNFGLFNKIKKESGTNVWCTFSARFSHKSVPYLVHYRLKKFHCHTKCVIKFLFRQLMM